MFEKVHVKGDEKAPVYKWLTDPAQNGWNSQEPSWNFCKYVINEKGELTHFFASKVTPDSVIARVIMVKSASTSGGWTLR